MTRAARATFMVGLISLAMVSQGCMSRLIGEGVEGTMGAKGAYFEEKPVASSKDVKALKDYRRFELGEVKNDLGSLVPPKFLEKFPEEFNKRLIESRLPTEGSGKTLVFQVTILHYEKADTADNIFGPLEEVVARVQLVDKDSGEVLAYGNAIGRTGKTVGLGPDTKAEGLARGIMSWAKAYYPKGEGEEADTE